MIQINLLKEPKTRKRSWLPTGSSVEIWVGVAAALAVIGIALWHWSLTSSLDEALVRRSELEQQSLELVAVRAELARYEDQQARLEERTQVIENLRTSQKGPVQLMNAIIEAMPLEPRLWLTSLTQQDNTVSIEGNAFDVPAIADFIAALDATDPFETVELNYWEDQEDRVAFGLNCLTRSQ